MHISVCLNIPIYSRTVSALLQWIMDAKSRRWLISYDTKRLCLSHYGSLRGCKDLSWGGGSPMSRPDWRARLFTPPVSSLQRDPKCLLMGGLKSRRRQTAKLGGGENSAEPLSGIAFQNWFRRLIWPRGDGGKFITGGFTVRQGDCNFICNEGGSCQRQSEVIAVQSPGRAFLTPSTVVW